MGSSPPSKLRQSLSVTNLVFYGVTYMVPTTGFTLYGWVHAAAGGGAVLAYLLAAFGIGLTGLSYAQLSADFPEAGSVYAYAGKSLGPLAGFVGAWSILLDYLLIPALTVLYGGIIMNQAIPLVPIEAWVAVFLMFATMANVLGLSWSTKVDFAVSGAQFAAIGVFATAAVALLLGGSGGGFTLAPVQPGAYGLAGTVGAASIVVVSFLGFDAISTLAEEVKEGNRARSIGRAILTCIAIMTMVLVGTTWLLEDLGQSVTVSGPTVAAFEIVGTRMEGLLWPLILLCGLALGIGASIPPQAAVARILFSMARDGTMPRQFALVHSRFASPHVAVVFTAVLMALCAWWGMTNLETLAGLVSFGALSGFMFVNLSVIVWFGVKQRSRNWLLHWICPAIGLLMCGYILSGMRLIALELGGLWSAIGLIAGLALAWRGRRLQGASEKLSIRTRAQGQSVGNG